MDEREQRSGGLLGFAHCDSDGARAPAERKLPRAHVVPEHPDVLPGQGGASLRSSTSGASRLNPVGLDPRESGGGDDVSARSRAAASWQRTRALGVRLTAELCGWNAVAAALTRFGSTGAR
jgi:hypothetical protein